MDPDRKAALLRIEGVLPASASVQALTAKSYCMGISLDNSVFSKQNISILVSWLCDRGTPILIFLGDALYRTTLLTFETTDVSEAEQLAEQRTDTLEELIRSQRPTADTSQLRIMRLTMQEAKSDFVDTRNQILKARRFSPNLDEDIRTISNSYLARQVALGRKFINSRELTEIRAQNYLIDELVHYTLLVREGWNTEIYPGKENPLLRSALEGKYPSLPQELRRRIFVQVGFSKREPTQ